MLRDVRTIVDLGAHIGLTTLYLLKFFPGANCVCVEPNPANAELLRVNLKGMLQAKIIESAINETEGTTIFSGDEASYAGHLSDNGDGTVVRCTTLPAILEQCSIDEIDLLKVDIEGAERFLFSNAAWLNRVHAIVIEIHDQYYSLGQFRTVVERHGLSVLEPGPQHRMIWAIRNSQ